MKDEEIKEAANLVKGLGGMTVNERLYESGLWDEFELAIKKDKEKARKILEYLKVDNPSINKIIK